MKKGLQSAGRERLTEWLGQGEHTQARIASTLQLSRPAVAQWVAGKTRPAPKHRAALEQLCGIPADGWLPAAAGPPEASPPTVPSYLDAAEAHARGLVEVRDAAALLSDRQARVEQALVAMSKRLDALEAQQERQRQATIGLWHGIERLGERLDETWLALAADQRLEELKQAAQACAERDGLPPPRPGREHEVHSSMARLERDACLVLGQRDGPMAARLMALLMSFVELQHQPRAEDYMAVLAVYERCGKADAFASLGRRFAALVRSKPGVPRTGTSFFRAVVNEEIQGCTEDGRGA